MLHSYIKRLVLKTTLKNLPFHAIISRDSSVCPCKRIVSSTDTFFNKEHARNDLTSLQLVQDKNMLKYALKLFSP